MDLFAFTVICYKQVDVKSHKMVYKLHIDTILTTGITHIYISVREQLLKYR